MVHWKFLIDILKRSPKQTGYPKSQVESMALEPGPQKVLTKKLVFFSESSVN